MQPSIGAGIDGHGDDAGLASLPGPLDVVAVGFFTGSLGVGQAARNVVTALRSAGLEVAAVEPVLLTDRRTAAFVTQPPKRAAVTIICANPPELPVLARAPLVPASDRRIGLWFWELDEIPESWIRSAEAFDEVWVTSRLALETLSLRTSVPVRLVPLPIGLPCPHGRDPAPIPKAGVRFLSVVDYLSTSARKNPLGAIAAFTRAFGPSDGPELVVKTLNAGIAKQEHRAVLEAAERWPHVHVLDGWLPRSDYEALLAGSTAVLSLHRAEAFGLPVAEAMLRGLPAVTTNYGGVLEYATEENAFLVPARRVRIAASTGPYPADAHWAEPDIEQAVQLLRRIVDHPTEARERAARAAVDVAVRHHPKVAGLKLVEALNEVAARPRRRTRPRISVVLPVSQPWPSARNAFDGIRSQVERVGGELVVVDGHGDGLADEQAGGVVLLREPGADAFQLRNLGIDVADGSIVAITEGHCVPDEHWVERMLSTHSSQPRADGVVGAVRNGTSSTLADRANFLATFALFTHPLTTLPPNRVPPVASLSFRRETLAASLRPGDLELVLLPKLSGTERLAPGDGIVVEHHQSHGGLARTVAIHYHNGRAIGGHARGEFSRADLQARIHWCIRFPRTIVTETRAALLERGLEPRAVELAVVSGLGAAHAIGHLIGRYFGPGSSAKRLH